MKKKLIGLAWLSIAIQLVAVPKQGGIGLMYVQSAKTLPKGYLEFFAGTRYFGKVSVSDASAASTLWVVQGYSAFNFGMNEHIEVSLAPIFYQDTHQSSDKNSLTKKSINLPDDLFLSIKFGSFRRFESQVLFGFQLTSRFPTGEFHNVIYEPYSAGRIELGLNGLLSYFSNVSFPDEGWSLHGNLGYLNHNDVGRELTPDPEDPTATAMSSELLLGLGLHVPVHEFEFSIEMNARYFMIRPPETAYSREYVSYLTPAVYYKPYPWLTFQSAFDIQLVSQEDMSVYSGSGETSLNPPPPDFPNYPTWRGMLGIKFHLLPSSLYKREEDVLRRQATERRQLIERMSEEETERDDAEEELNRIQSERRKVEQELERLRKLLENEKKNNQ